MRALAVARRALPDLEGEPWLPGLPFVGEVASQREVGGVNTVGGNINAQI